MWPFKKRKTPMDYLDWCYDYERLAKYNSEKSRGIVHTDEYASKMADIQHRYDLDWCR